MKKIVFSDGPWMPVLHKEQDVKEPFFLIIQTKRVNAHNIAKVIPYFGSTDLEIEGNAKIISFAPQMYQLLSNIVECGYIDGKGKLKNGSFAAQAERILNDIQK